MKKKVVIAVLLLLPPLVIICVMLNRPPRNEVPAQRTRIRALISTLGKETLDQSAGRLITDDQQYLFPGYHTSVAFAQVDLEMMLSARRSIKVLESTEKLPQMGCATECEQLFTNAFRAHSNYFCTFLRHEGNSSVPGKEQSPLASKLALCAAMFTTADIGRADLLSAQFVQLDKLRNEIEPLLLTEESTHPQGPALSLLSDLVPDNRFQVNVLRLVALRSSGIVGPLQRVDAECISANMTVSAILIVPWNSQTTWFDKLVGSPIDTRKGVTDYRFYDWAIGDLLAHKDLQNQLIIKLRSIVFP